MSILIQCPACSAPIGNISSDGTLQAICASCWYRFGAAYGSVTRRLSEVKPVQRRIPNLPIRHQRHYEFHVQISSGTQVLQCSTPGEGDPIPVSEGDLVSFLYTLRGDRLEEMISVTNPVTGNTYRLASPGSTAVRTAIGWGLVSSVPMFLVLFPNAVEFPIALLASVSSIPLVSILAARLKSPKIRLDSEQKARLAAEQQLFGEKIELEQRVEELRRKLTTNQARLNQLEALNQKMGEVGADLYAKRIERVSRAIAILSQQLGQDQHLINQYVRTIKMIEIELETSRAVDAIPNTENFMGMIFDRLAELKMIDQKTQQLRAQVEADEAVRSLQP